jgi:hypothetical protein
MTKKCTLKCISGTFIALLCSSQFVNAQSSTADFSAEDGKNLVKMNVAAAIVTKTLSFQYERAVANKISVAIGFRTMPKSSLPFSSKLENLADDNDAEARRAVRDFRTSNFAITPEVRFYMGKGVFQGFYLAPFLSYARYNVESPITVDVPQLNSTESIVFRGDVKSFTGGVMIGAQWKLSKLVFLDWWIAGPHFGTSTGKLAGQKALNQLEQQELRGKLSDLLDDLPVVKPTYAVDGNGATIDVKGPWGGVRAGLAVGFRF